MLHDSTDDEDEGTENSGGGTSGQHLVSFL